MAPTHVSPESYVLYALLILVVVDPDIYTSGTHAQAHTTITIKLRITINQVSGLDNPWSLDNSWRPM